MKYEIAYISQSGNSEKLAHGIADGLPQDSTFVTDLSCEKVTGKADIYLIVFGINRGMVPLKVMELLEELHGKILLFFITSGMEPVQEYRDAMERKLLPFIPDDCDYRGLFMCPGRFPEHVLRAAQEKLAVEPEYAAAKNVLSDAELSADHPNQTDIENAGRFIREHLGS